MKRFLLAVVLVIGFSSVASAQYPYYGYYQPPMQYNYSYFYLNPTRNLPGIQMSRFNAYPAYPVYQPYARPYQPTYFYGNQFNYRW